MAQVMNGMSAGDGGECMAGVGKGFRKWGAIASALMLSGCAATEGSPCVDDSGCPEGAFCEPTLQVCFGRSSFAKSSRVVGTAVLDGETSHQGIEVTLSGSGATTLVTETAADGSYQFEGVVPGVYAFNARRAEFEDATFEISVEPIALTNGPPAVLTRSPPTVNSYDFYLVKGLAYHVNGKGFGRVQGGSRLEYVDELLQKGTSDVGEILSWTPNEIIVMPFREKPAFWTSLRLVIVPSGATINFRPTAFKSVSIAAGESHNLVLRPDGAVTAWGDDNESQSTPPVGLNGVRIVAARGSTSLAVRKDGTVVAWGDPTYSTVPRGLSNVAAVSVGAHHFVARQEMYWSFGLSENSVVAWGDNSVGQTDVPADLKNVLLMASGAFHNVAYFFDPLTRLSGVVQWGSYGCLVPCLRAVPEGLDSLMGLAAGDAHSVALKNDGTVVAWGAFGLLPVPDDLIGVVAIAAGGGHTLALKSDGTVVAWGLNDSGQTQVPSGLTSVTAIAAGSKHSLALRMNGEIVAWGANYNGQAQVPRGVVGFVPAK